MRADEFWNRGHIPGRPILPGVIMIEASAQLATYFFKHRFPETADRFMVFRGVNEFRFRAQVVGGDTESLSDGLAQGDRIDSWWSRVAAILGRDGHLHAATLSYYGQGEHPDPDHGFEITPRIREVWRDV